MEDRGRRRSSGVVAMDYGLWTMDYGLWSTTMEDYRMDVHYERCSSY
jgi:hypothetical protein